MSAPMSDERLTDAEVAAIRDWHNRDWDTAGRREVCGACYPSLWPCRTIRLLNERDALAAEVAAMERIARATREFVDWLERTQMLNRYDYDGLDELIAAVNALDAAPAPPSGEGAGGG
jgi:hypothetical protein